MSSSNPAMALPPHADTNAVTGELRPGLAAMRLLRHVLDPATTLKSVMAASIVVPAVLSGIHPFQPRNLVEALEEAYHLYHGCGPGALIVWRKEEMPDLLVIARAMMDQDRKGKPFAPETPILPTAPAIPTLPCCGGSLSGVLPSQRRKPGTPAKAGVSQTSPT